MYCSMSFSLNLSSHSQTFPFPLVNSDISTTLRAVYEYHDLVLPLSVFAPPPSLESSHHLVSTGYPFREILQTSRLSSRNTTISNITPIQTSTLPGQAPRTLRGSKTPWYALKFSWTSSLFTCPFLGITIKIFPL